MTCVDTAGMDALRSWDLRPTDEAGWELLDQQVSELCAGCLEHTGAAVLPQLHSENVARDTDLLRRALGEKQINYLGVSYGTFLGLTYASLFPKRLRAVILDSAVPPMDDMRVFTLRVAAGYEEALDRFFADCGGDAGCAFHGGEGTDAVAAAFDAVVAQAAAAPIPAGSDGRVLGSFDLGVAAWGLLRLGTWSDLADFDMAAYRAFLAEAEVGAPRMASTFGWFLLACAHWPVTRTVPGPVLGAPTAPPMLVVNGRHDPATPQAFAEELVQVLSNDSYLLLSGSEGHATGRQNVCAFSAELAFLHDPSQPPAQLTCERRTCGTGAAQQAHDLGGTSGRRGARGRGDSRGITTVARPRPGSA